MKTGIIGAERQEVDLLFAELASSGGRVVVNRRGPLEIHEGVLHNCPVAVVCCGIGKVNAALCAQLLISEFSVECLINTGSAGGLHPELQVLDMVAATETVQHDFDTTPFGYAPGQVPGTDSPFVKADSQLRRLAMDAFARSGGRGGRENLVAPDVRSRAHRMIAGRIASGDAFITDESRRERIRQLFDPACVEMEGAAIAHVCSIYGIPFCVLRSISDLAGKDAGMSYEEFSRHAALTSAHVVMEMAASLADMSLRAEN